MDQTEFNSHIIPKLISKFPQFENLCSNTPDNIVEIDWKSPKGLLTLRLTTRDMEITVGFTKNTYLDWHTHMSMFGANTLSEEFDIAVQIIDNIINNKEKILYSNLTGYSIVDEIEDFEKYKKDNEIVEIFFWKDL